jgi:hypothetical protein
MAQSSHMSGRKHYGPGFFMAARHSERMNRTIKEATVKRYHYDSHAQLERHLKDFVDAYNFLRRLKTLKGFTPMSSSAKSGLQTQNDSSSTRSSKCRD